jgi:hypothetical protein
MKEKIKLKNIWLHFRKIQKHRKYVRQYCFWAGIPWRGITHDLSKYSPTEFWESVRFYTGTSSPINEAKKQQGYSKAWLHHKGRNKHHWAYWADNFSEGMEVYTMPEKDFVELVCDFLGAAKAYSEDNFSYTNEFKWWMLHKELDNKAMALNNKIMLDIIFSDLMYAEQHPIATEATPKQLIKSGYIQKVWRANCGKCN